MIISLPLLHTFPTLRFLQEAMTLRLLLFAALFFTILSAALFLTHEDSAAFLGCGEGENLLVYPMYGKKGDVVDQMYRCGIPHKTCALRTAPLAGPTYDCSPFMAPKGALTER